MRPRIFMVGYSTDKGGVESYIRNLCDELRADFDIVFHWPVMILGGKEWHIPANRHNPLKYCKFWTRFFRENKFDIIYFNTCDIVSIDILRFAKHAEIPVRIIHSHSAAREYASNGLKGLVHRWQERQSRKHLDKYATHIFACSESAGDWMFNGRPYTIIKNGIDIDKYIYNKAKGDNAASILMQKSHPAIACLGRLDPSKNPLFSIRIFKSLCSVSADVQCLYIGDGDFRQTLEKEVRNAGLQDRIFFTGGVDNVNEWLSYVDCILMPSLFEGLPFALVEAQAAGLHCLVSDNVSQESNITGLVEYMSLEAPADEWAKRALALAAAPRVNVTEKLEDAGFSIRHTAETVGNVIKKALR